MSHPARRERRSLPIAVPGVHGSYLPYMVKMTPSVKASTFEASCELFTVARVARRRLRNGVLWYHIWNIHDWARRWSASAVLVTLGVTITVYDSNFSRFTPPYLT